MYLLPRIAAVCFVTTAQIAGCSQRESSRPETAIVRGVVTYQGKPIPQAAVTFSHAGAPRFSSGRTDANGRFELTTFTPGDGAIVGNNMVAIVKRVAATGSVERVDPAAADNAAIDAAFDRAATQALPRSAIPVRYANRGTSGLRRNVRPGMNEFEFELTD